MCTCYGIVCYAAATFSLFFFPVNCKRGNEKWGSIPPVAPVRGLHRWRQQLFLRNRSHIANTSIQCARRLPPSFTYRQRYMWLVTRTRIHGRIQASRIKLHEWNCEQERRADTTAIIASSKREPGGRLHSGNTLKRKLPCGHHYTTTGCAVNTILQRHKIQTPCLSSTVLSRNRANKKVGLVPPLTCPAIVAHGRCGCC